MICRALGFAAGLLLISGGLAEPVRAQENLDAGKSPSQLFAGNCSACHKSPRGLLKTIPAGSLPGFLRQHYTTSPEMAGVLAGYLTANGAGDVRGGGRNAKPDAEGAPSERTGRRHRRSAAEPGAAEPATPAPETTAGTDADKPRGRHGHKSAKHRHGDEAKPAAEEKPAEAPKVAAPKETEPAPTTTQSIPSGTSEPAPSAEH